MSRPLQTKEGVVAQSRSPFSSILTLALWRLRQTWWQLLLAGLALLAALMVACVVPLFSAVATTAGLQGVFNGAPLRSDFALATTAQGLSTTTLEKTYQRFDSLIRPPFGAYLDGGQAPLVIQLPNLGIARPASLRTAGSLSMYATSLRRLQPDLTLVQGHWPSGAPGTFEIMMTPETASALHLSVGETLTLSGHFTTNPKAMKSGPVDNSLVLNARLAGLFEAATQGAPDLFGADFQPVINQLGASYTFLASESALVAQADQWAARGHADALFSLEPFQLTWYYHLHTTQLQMSRVNDLTSRLDTVQQRVGREPNDQQGNFENLPTFPYVLSSQFYNPLPQHVDILSLLQQFNSRVALVSIPVMVLALQVVLLLFFFACLLFTMLVDRQVAINALLSTRGATPRQIFWSLVTQAFALCLLALLLGPVLAVLLVEKIARAVLPASEQHVVALTIGQMGQILPLIAPYVAGTLAVSVLAICLIMRRAVGGNILELRRETSRSSKQPFWLRYYLDVLAAVIALSSFGTSLYLASVAHSLDASTQDLIIAPLTLVAPLFLLLSCLLLFLRFFPLFLSFCAWCARPTRGATGMLALVQMARAPRPAMRMTMLLTLAVAFTLFALVLNASQARRALDVAAYESGADFSGNLPGTLDFQSVSAVTSLYTHVPGVLSATVGYASTGDATGFDNSDVSMELRAVDARTFASTAIWDSQDSTRPLSGLMRLLLSQAKNAPNKGVVPAIVDEATASQLDVAVGDNFFVTFSGLVNITLGFQVVAVVARIPTVNSSAAASTVSSPGGLLVDYSTLKAVFSSQLTQRLGQLANSSNVNTNLPLNYVWLRTRDDARALASVRAALNSSQLGLSTLFDRREIIDELQHDPLSFTILLMLSIGGVAALALALVGDLIASWLSVRMRRGSFVVLRALGASARQIAALLLWEQALVYVTALVLSVVFGLALIKLAVPVLVFTGLPAKGGMSELSTSSFYLLQQIVPVQVIVPLSIRLAFVGLALLCLLALVLMVRAALGPSMIQELRLNED
jgi:ABC-type lipoprotein release transport system permease subunit